MPGEGTRPSDKTGNWELATPGVGRVPSRGDFMNHAGWGHPAFRQDWQLGTGHSRCRPRAPTRRFHEPCRV